MILRDVPLPLRLVGLWAVSVGAAFVVFGGLMLFVMLGVVAQAAEKFPPPGSSAPSIALSVERGILAVTCDCPRRGVPTNRRLLTLAVNPEDSGVLDIVDRAPVPSEAIVIPRADGFSFPRTADWGVPAISVRAFPLARGRTFLLALDTAAAGPGRVRWCVFDPAADSAAPAPRPASVGARNFGRAHFAEAGGRIWTILNDRDQDAILVWAWEDPTGPEFRIEGSLRSLLFEEDGAVLLVERISTKNLAAVRLGAAGPDPEVTLPQDPLHLFARPVFFLHRGRVAALDERQGRFAWTPDAAGRPIPPVRIRVGEILRRPEARIFLPVLLIPLAMVLIFPLLALGFARVADRWIEAENPPAFPVAGSPRRAALHKRTLAFLADAVVVTLPNLLAAGVFVALLLGAIDGMTPAPNAPPPPRFFLTLAIGIPLLMALGWGFPIFYQAFLESRAGQTIGKRLVGIRVVTASGAPPRLFAAILRAVLRFVDQSFFYCLSAVILVGMSPQGRTLGDLAAETYVVES